MDYTKMSHASLVEELTRRDRGEALTHTEKAVQQSKNIESLKPNLPLEFAPAVPLVVGLDSQHPHFNANQANPNNPMVNPNPNFVPNTNQPNPLVIGQTKPIGGQSGVSTPVKNNPLGPNPLDPTKHETTKP